MTLIMPPLTFSPSLSFTKSQKRASVLLSDVSQSIFAALAAPTPGPASVGPSPRIHASSKAQRSAAQEQKSLLEDDDLGAEAEKQLGDVLVPNVLTPTPITASTVTTKAHAQKDTTMTDDDDWNW